MLIHENGDDTIAVTLNKQEALQVSALMAVGAVYITDGGNSPQVKLGAVATVGALLGIEEFSAIMELQKSSHKEFAERLLSGLKAIAQLGRRLTDFADGDAESEGAA